MSMASRSMLWALASALLAHAMPSSWPVETPMGLMCTGFSPMPTPAPGAAWNELPKELRRRQQVIPPNWCGFIDGDTGRVLSCDSSTRCVSFGTAVGCCGNGDIATCTDLYTSCVDTATLCDGDCLRDFKILKCPGAQQHSYCATYSFTRDFTKYDCVSGTSIATSVALIQDFYATVSAGPLLGTSSIQGLILSNPTQPTSSTSHGSSTLSAAGSNTTPSNSLNSTRPASGVIITGGAIAGIVGGVVLIGAILGLVFFFCCRRSRRNKTQIGQPQMQHSSAPAQPYGGAAQLHGTSSPYPPPNAAPYPSPPQYAVAGGGYYADPKDAVPEVDGTPNGRLGAGQPPGPYRQADTVSPISAPTTPYGGQPQDYWARHAQQQPQPQYPPGPVYEIGPGAR